MKILLISPGGDRFGGGMGTVTKNIKDYLIENSQIPVQVYDSRGEIGFFLSFFFLFRSIVSVIAQILFSKEKIILHVNVSERASFYRKFCFVLIAKIFRVPCILHHHGAELIQFYETCNSLSRRVTSYCINNASSNIVLGEKWKNFLQVNFKKSAPCTILYNAVPRTGLVKTEGEKFTICMIANLSERKGVSIALESAAMLKNDCNFTLHFIGGGEVEKYSEQSKTLGLTDQCIFHGWISRSETQQLMINSDVMILPSYDEGLPMVILEAMAHSIPVICTPVGSIGEVFSDKNECLFMEVGSAESLYNNIRCLQSDKELRLQICKNASTAYEQSFSIEGYMKCLIKLYKSLV